MNLSAVAATIDEIIRSLRYFENINYLESDEAVDLLDDAIIDLENLADDLRIEEVEALIKAECGNEALCLYCGERFRHGMDHGCPQLLLRGDRGGEGTI